MIFCCNYNLLMHTVAYPTLFLLSAWFVLLTACSPLRIESPSRPPTLIPFATSTQGQLPPTGTLQTPEGVVAAETPLPTPTPFAYTIQQGDTISSIALRFGV